MTLVDTNLLLYATFADAPEHERARRWLEERLAEGDGTVALCWRRANFIGAADR